MSKITMTRDLRGELPALPDFDGLKLHTWNDESAAAWNWIHQSGCMNPTGLEGTGLLHTQRTAGRFVTEDTAVIRSAKEDLARSRTREYLESMAQLGYDRQQVKALLEEWKEE